MSIKIYYVAIIYISCTNQVLNFPFLVTKFTNDYTLQVYELYISIRKQWLSIFKFVWGGDVPLTIQPIHRH